MSEKTFRDAYAVLQRHAETLRNQREPNIDDLRESPAMTIAMEVARQATGRVVVVEPHIEQLPHQLRHLELVSLDTAKAEADILGLLVAHDDFAALREWPAEGKFLVDAAGLLGQHPALS